MEEIIFNMSNINYNKEDIASHHGIAAVIKNSQGQVLMQEHVKYGFWTIPVGKVLESQSLENGLKQELFEECDITIEEFKEIKAKEFKYKRNGNSVIVYAHLFDINKYSGIVRNKEPKKHKTQIFMELEKIKNLPYISDMTLLYLETLGFKREATL